MSEYLGGYSRQDENEWEGWKVGTREMGARQTGQSHQGGGRVTSEAEERMVQGEHVECHLISEG